jgi:hypothetical protein
MVGIHKENLQEPPLFGKILWFSLQINAQWLAQGASWPNGWRFASAIACGRDPVMVG